jgi:5-oxoprolinase (ATP-hydrolysing) subunit A
MTTLDLNADVGEAQSTAHLGQDPALMPFLTSASIACGGHAGDAATMAVTVELARAHRVAIGAHPGFVDRAHFGRREQQLTSEQIRRLISDQVRALAEVAATRGIELQHVKPHGALYNMAARDQSIAQAIADAVAGINRGLALFGLSGSELIAAGKRAGLRTVSEVFADRGYLPDGSLAPRGRPGAIINDPDAVALRAVAMVRDQAVPAIDGTRVPLVAETICVHSDTPGAAELARRIRAALDAAGITVVAPTGGGIRSS